MDEGNPIKPAIDPATPTLITYLVRYDQRNQLTPPEGAYVHAMIVDPERMKEEKFAGDVGSGIGYAFMRIFRKNLHPKTGDK